MGSVYADIIVDVTNEKLDRTFQYKVPPELNGKIEPGTAVEIPFGNGNRTINGYVLSVGTEAKYLESRMKTISGVRKDAAAVETKLIALAAWMRRTYGSTMIQALKTVLPVKVKARGKETREIALLADHETCEKLLETYEKKNYKARIRLLDALMTQPVLPGPVVSGKLKITADTLRAMEEQGILEIRRTSTWRNPVADKAETGRQGTPNEQQQQVVDGILQEWSGQNRPCLIRGVTGSGKTLVYMELMERVLAEGKQVIVLIPEIALTYQNVERFCARFGTRVTVVNSRMTPSERADQMERARRGEVSIMIGPRSALFAPFPDLGLIVIDEEHETSYKSEVTPRYHARETAVRRAELEHAHVVMGSATPSVDASYACETGAYALFRMDARYGNAVLPSVWIADMREELQKGNRSILSEKLQKEIEERLKRKEQTVLFLNRRGYAGFVSCRSCGHVMKCPHCDVSLTAHNNGMLVCHYCGYERPQVRSCPSCGSPYIGGFRAGTQQIEQNVKKVFPKARILRMDGDTTKTKNSYEEILSSFAAGKADILIGTQMIVKGHDFPNVTLVGALAADLSLNAVDYRAGERTFQLLTQAVGRAGRGEKQGMAVIQTYHPEHYSIQTAAKQDYETFYEKEMDYRRLMGYPPAAELLAVHGAGENEAHLAQAMEYIRKYLVRVKGNREIQIVGPASEAVSKINDLYRMAVYVRASKEEVLTELREKLERYIEINKGFRTVYRQFDFSRKY